MNKKHYVGHTYYAVKYSVINQCIKCNLDKTNKIPPPQVVPLINYANSCKLPLIIDSDTNAQHKLWGNKEWNGRGEELLDFLNNFGLSRSNKGSVPTFINSSRHESIIDLTITNNLGCDLIGNWKVDLKYSNSDHRYDQTAIRTAIRSKFQEAWESHRLKNNKLSFYNSIKTELIQNLTSASTCPTMK